MSAITAEQLRDGSQRARQEGFVAAYAGNVIGPAVVYDPENLYRPLLNMFHVCYDPYPPGGENVFLISSTEMEKLTNEYGDDFNEGLRSIRQYLALRDSVRMLQALFPTPCPRECPVSRAAALSGSGDNGTRGSATRRAGGK